jgi:hypothetical protein
MSKRKFLQHQTLYVKTYVQFIVTGVYKSAKRALLCNNQYFCVVDSDAYLDNTHRKCIVVFPLQQWLEERAAALCYITLPVLFRPKYPNFGHFFTSYTLPLWSEASLAPTFPQLRHWETFQLQCTWFSAFVSF